VDDVPVTPPKTLVIIAIWLPDTPMGAAMCR